MLSHTSKYIALCIYFHIDIDFFSIEFAAIYASEYSNYIAWDWENKIDNNKNFPLISHWFRWNCYLLGSKLHRLIRIFWGISQPQRLQSSQYPLDRLVCSTLHILDCVCQQPKYHFAYARAHSNSARVRKTQLCAFACTQSETMERKEKKNRCILNQLFIWQQYQPNWEQWKSDTINKWPFQTVCSFWECHIR